VAQFDLRGDALTGYRSTTPKPEGFDAFWARTLAETRAHPLDVRFERVDTGLELVDTFDVTFAGFGGHPVKAWLAVPRASSSSPEPHLGAVVEFVGYGGGRGLAHETTLYALAGWAHLRMDTRGQGSNWSVGDTPDLGAGGEPHFPGFLTRGITSPENHYYRRVFADAVRAVEAVRAFPAVDAARVAVAGGSQGGAMAIAVGGLLPGLAAVAPDVPFLCDIRRATTIVDTYPYAEVVQYLHAHRDHVDAVFQTLDHVDAVHHAASGTAPSLWSVGLMDDTCPPSTVYAAFNAWAGEKRIIEYPFNVHEGGGAFQERERLAFLRKALA
jgi:cephalosporin-C deacetylase